MKKILSVLLIVMMLSTCTAFATETLLISPAPVMVEKNVDVIVNGEKLVLDVSPVILNDRTMLPMRAIFEALGAKVNWIPTNNIIIATKDDTMVTLQINNVNMSIQKATSDENTVVTLDAAPFILRDRTLVPVRAVAEALNADVSWDPLTGNVTVTQNEGTNSAGTN